MNTKKDKLLYDNSSVGFATIVVKFRACINKDLTIYDYHVENTVFFYSRSNAQNIAYILEAFTTWAWKNQFTDIQIISIETKNGITCGLQDECTGPFYEVSHFGVQNRIVTRIIKKDKLELELTKIRKHEWETLEVVKLNYDYFIPLKYSSSYEACLEALPF